MNTEYITVFTPTYNRAYKLGDVYISLISQTYTQFEWLIIDDGSTDDTKDIVQTFIKEKKLNIRYVYKEHEGKHIAINKAAELAHGEWIFFLDSDDKLTENALAIVAHYCSMIKSDQSFAGVVGLKGNLEGKVWNTFSLAKIKSNTGTSTLDAVEQEYFDATIIEYRYKYKIQGDRAEVVRTEILKKYPFPQFVNETFMPENYLWFSLSRDGYKFRWFNKVIYIAEYLEDGLTKNGKELAKRNSCSRSFLDNFIISLSGIPVKEKIKSAINYFRYGKYSGKSYNELFTNCNNKWIGLISLPIAFLYKIK